MKFTKIVLVALISVWSMVSAWAQQGQRVEVSSSTLQAGTYKGEEVRRLIGNVVMRQGATTVTSDSAYQYVKDRNRLEVFGNVHITQETMEATSATGTYDGTRRMANLRGNVVLRDQEMTLNTPTLEYDLDAKRAYYTQTGHIVGPDYTIKSHLGTYTTTDKVLTFKKDVVYTNTQNTKVVSDTMAYNTISKVVEFFGPTTITSPDGTLFANRGTYNTVTREANFRGNASIKTPDYLIKGNSLTYDKLKEYYTAAGNVSLTHIKENTVITGQTALHWRGLGRSKVFGSPVMRTVAANSKNNVNDTMFLSADTLLAVENRVDKTKKGFVYAYPDVRIYKSDLQGICDSLTYNLQDSMIYMNRSPKLWANKSQMTADSVIMQLRDKTLDQMRMFGNSFAISQDTLENFNQVKGRNMTAHFAEGKIRRIDVNGNGESLYFALQGDSTVMGMNKAFCSDMRMKFNDGQVQSITFLTEPDAKLIPPHELEEPEKRLKGFVWRADEKPTRAFVLEKRGVARKKSDPAAASSPARGAKPAAVPPKKNGVAAPPASASPAKVAPVTPANRKAVPATTTPQRKGAAEKLRVE
ncbi:OstA-like protein [Rufibacter ruber]|uniref:OstA-like protein n=1 Tax=Rufibacter ruber TaxID=1783499 RepID=UPI0009EDB3FE|nr:OstA-like protein [Rufibacter ruber]